MTDMDRMLAQSKLSFERDRQIGRGWTPERDATHDEAEWTMLLGERLGLLAGSALHGTPEQYERRLIELGAVALAALEALYAAHAHNARAFPRPPAPTPAVTVTPDNLLQAARDFANCGHLVRLDGLDGALQTLAHEGRESREKPLALPLADIPQTLGILVRWLRTWHREDAALAGDGA